jgi:hypothetical protein
LVAAGVRGLLHFVSLIGPVAVALLRDCVRLGFALCRWTPRSKQFRGGYRRVCIPAMMT